MSPEIGPKMAIVRKVTRQLKRVFLRDPGVPPPKKALVIQALILSKGFHLGGCWPLLLPREARQVKRAVIELLRPLLGDRPLDARQSDDEEIKELGVLFPVRLLSLLRVQVAIRVASQAPWPVLLLLFETRSSQRSWLAALSADLAHFARAACLAEFVNAPLAKWFIFFRDFPIQAKKVVVKAAGETNWMSVEEQERERTYHTYCLECGTWAQGKQSLSIHMLRSHGVRRAIRSYVEGTTCLVCGVMFASRQRLIDHIAEQPNQLCMHNYILRYPTLEPEVVRKLDVEGRSEFSRRRRLEGAHGVRIHGPFY